MMKNMVRKRQKRKAEKVDPRGEKTNHLNAIMPYPLKTHTAITLYDLMKVKTTVSVKIMSTGEPPVTCSVNI